MLKTTKSVYAMSVQIETNLPELFDITLLLELWNITWWELWETDRRKVYRENRQGDHGTTSILHGIDGVLCWYRNSTDEQTDRTSWDYGESMEYCVNLITIETWGNYPMDLGLVWDEHSAYVISWVNTYTCTHNIIGMRHAQVCVCGYE